MTDKELNSQYLIKSYIYNPSANITSQYKDFWLTAATSTKEHIALHPYGFPQLTFLSQLNETGHRQWRMDDYSCFAGGNLLLGGKYLGRDDLVALGRAVTDSCHQTFNTTTSGLNPRQFAWYNEENKSYDPSYDSNPTLRSFAKKNGYFIENASWAGFPEPIESLFYAYRITGEPIWKEYAWKIAELVHRNTKRQKKIPYMDLDDVRMPFGGKAVDYVPSYYFAETLKYQYLIYSPPGLLSLDEWVFNTEGHPFRIQKSTCATSH